jgi:hypothetical protein
MASFANSAGWSEPTPGITIHRREPLISDPIPGTSTATSNASVMT